MRSIPYILLLTLALLGCGKNDPRSASAAYGKKPYLQTAIQGCLSVSGLYIDPRGKVLQEILYEDSLADLESAEAMRRLSASTGDGRILEFRLKVAPSPECRDSVNFHASDVVYGQARGQEGIDNAIKAFHQGLASRLWLKVGERRVKPSFHHVESILGLDNSREVWVVFRLSDQDRADLARSGNIEMAADNVVPGQGIFILTWPGKVLANGA